MRKLLTVALAIVTSGAVAALIAGSEQSTEMKPAEHGLFTPTAIEWKDGPPSLPPGAKVAVLEGPPSKEGPVTFRLWMPDGYKVMPHWHPAVEHITVISGTFNLGMGDQFDKAKGNALPAGGFAFMPPKMNHFAWTSGETVIQIHALGPWQINYVNPADDPRLAKK